MTDPVVQRALDAKRAVVGGDVEARAAAVARELAAALEPALLAHTIEAVGEIEEDGRVRLTIPVSEQNYGIAIRGIEEVPREVMCAAGYPALIPWPGEVTATWLARRT